MTAGKKRQDKINPYAGMPESHVGQGMGEVVT